MNYETRTHKQIIDSGDLVSFPEAVGIPKKYEHWVNARGAHMAPALLTRVGELMDDPNSVLANSVSVASDFHEALGVDYKVLDVENTEEINGKSLFLYRNNSDMDDSLGRYLDINLVANPREMMSVGKEILHPSSDGIVDVPSLLDANNVEGIPVAVGAVADSEEEMVRMVELFRKAGKDFILKDPNGTDGNGITTNPAKVEKFPVVIEEKLDIEETISVQYQNGVLGVMNERDKPDGDEPFDGALDKRWRGNTLPFTNGGMEDDVQKYAEIFSDYLAEKLGVKPVIFGMDFAVYKDSNGVEKLAFIDPNIRMPGNMYVYYQKALLENAGYDVPFVETALLYEDDVPQLNGYKLQKVLDEMDFGLIKYDKDGGVDGIRTDKSGNPEGVLVIAQDKGSEDSPDNLGMINVFGADQGVTGGLLERYLQI